MAFPTDEVDVEVSLFMGGAWVDAITDGNGIRVSDGITISRGRSNWASQVDPSRARFTLDNRDGRWSPDYASGAHAGNYKRNIPVRIGVGGATKHLLSEGLNSTVATTPDIAGTGGGAPTAPAFSSVTTSSETAYTTTHTVDMPATLANTDRLLLIINSGHTSLAPSGTDLDDWTQVDSFQKYFAPTDWSRVLIYEIQLDATSAAALAAGSVDFITTSATKSSSQVIRTTGARAGGQGTAWDYIRTASKSFSASPDSPSLTTSWGADEHRWYTGCAYGAAANTVSAYPTSYTSIANNDPVNNDLGIGTAHRTTSAATENPAAFTLTGSENWQAFTFVYRANEDTSSDGVMDISGDIDLRIDLQLLEDPLDSDFNPSPPDIVLAKKTAGFDGFDWRLYRFEGDVHMSFLWIDSGGGFNWLFTTDAGAALPAAVRHDRISLRVTLDVNNGAAGHDVRFYYGTAGVDGAWTQIGSTITTAGTSSIKTNDAQLSLVSGGNFIGRVYEFQMRDGIGGTAATNPDFSAQTVGVSSFVDAAGRTWTIGSGGAITDKRWRFHGELSSLPVRWNVDGSDVTAPAEASGLFRRLRQGARPLLSPIRRAIGADFEAFAAFGFDVQYWPLEEEKALTQFGAVAGTAPFIITGTDVNAAAENVMDGSRALPTLGTSSIKATVDNYSGPYDEWSMQWLQKCPADFTGDNFDYLRVDTTDMIWEVRYRDDAGGQLQLRARRGLTNVYASAWTAFNVTGAADRAILTVTQNGSNVNVQLLTQGQNDTTAGGFTVNNAVAGAPGRVTGITFNQGGDVGTWAFGHVSLHKNPLNATYVQAALNGHASEKAGNRVARICQEEGIAVHIQGDPADTEIMGPQQPGTLLDVLEECAATDLGILHESVDTIAIGYRTRNSMRNQTPQIALDYAAGEVARSPELDRDDQDFSNDVTVRNWSGATARATLDDGSDLSISQPPAGAGRYDSVFTVNSQDARLPTIASNLLTLSTADEPRVSRLSVALHHSALVADATLTGNVLDAELGDLVTVANNLTVALGTITLSQILQGYTERIFPFEWQIDMLTSPGSPWGIGEVLGPADPHSVEFRQGIDLAVPGSPEHVLTALNALGYTGTGVPSLRDVGTHDFHTLVSSPITMCGEEDTVAPTIQPGDLVVFAGQGDQTHTFGSDWTVHLNTLHDGKRIFVVSTIAGAATNYDITFTGTDAIDAQMYVFAGAGGVSAFASAASDVDGFSGSSTFPTVSVADDQSMVLLGSIGSGNSIGTVGTPLTVSGFTPTAQNLFGYFIGGWTKTADAGSESGHTITYPGGEYRTEYALVIEPQGPTIQRSQLDAILDNWVAGTGGTIRNVTNESTWTTAMANVVPGDLVRITSSFTLTGNRIEARGDLYGIAGATMTTSTDGGLPGLPIIVTCADGVELTGNSLTNSNPILSVDNCRHVWVIGFNVAGTTQFGIRLQNAGGSAGFPAYIAYCDVNQPRDASVLVGGWFQLIADSGGTPPSDPGGERGFSEYVVVESNTITDPNPGDVAGNPGEGVYLGNGANVWQGYARDVWVRGNSVANFKANAYEAKPGCRRIYFTDNVAVAGRMQNGAAFELAYLGTAASRPAWADGVDFEIYCEGNRIYDLNITETGTSRNSFILMGIAGTRVANNLLWSARNAAGLFGTADTFYSVLVGHESLTTDFGDATTIPTWLVNNNFQSRGYQDPVGHTGVVFANNIVPSGYDGGTSTSTTADFIATVPAVGSNGTAQWLTYGPGSAYDLALTSALIGAGTTVTQALFIDADISQRAIPSTSPNPGPFQPHPANT